MKIARWTPSNIIEITDKVIREVLSRPIDVYIHIKLMTNYTFELSTSCFKIQHVDVHDALSQKRQDTRIVRKIDIDSKENNNIM